MRAASYACCFRLYLTVSNCACGVIFLVAAFAALRWTKWCLHCSCVSAGGVLDEVPVILLYSNPLVPCCAVCGAMICWCGSEEEDDNEKK